MERARSLAGIWLAGCLAAGCAPLPAYPESPEWSRERGRFVEEGSPVEPGLARYLRRTLAPSARGHEEGWRPPQVDNDGALLRSGRLSPSVTWIGHATVLLQLAGRNVLTDPNWSAHVLFVPRRSPPGVALRDLPPIDAVLISHDHRDHLDEDTIEALRRTQGERPVYIVPLGIGPWLRDHGITNVVELDWWQSIELPPLEGRPPVRVTLAPAQHWGRRGLLDLGRRLWGSFLVEGGGLTVYFAGDSGYGPHFREIAARLPRIDLALLPVGAFLPRAEMAPRHMSPEDAARAARDLRARWAMPIHWGTFRLGDEPMGDPPRRFVEALGPGPPRAYVLPIGGILRLPRAAPRPPTGEAEQR